MKTVNALTDAGWAVSGDQQARVKLSAIKSLFEALQAVQPADRPYCITYQRRSMSCLDMVDVLLEHSDCLA